ncbi:MAG: DUF4294 domain-containing protein [Chitinophagaceae bacterium]|nr:DUF4294 domain-containing protein [Chitinophagaceae bacterium]
MRFPGKHIILSVLVILMASLTLSAQERGPYDTVRVYAYITPEGDTIPESILPPVEVIGKLTGKWKRHWAEWTRLRNAVYVTYPYAMAASKVMNEINARLVNVSDKQKRRAIIKSREKELKKEFADQLTKLSVYQGKVLMKLIYRQTGNNCYEIIQEYKGGFNAAFWQTIAVIFGSNLKQNYDPYNKDRDMETIVRDVEVMYGYKS